jgi:hypothetical protein
MQEREDSNREMIASRWNSRNYLAELAEPKYPDLLSSAAPISSRFPPSAAFSQHGLISTRQAGRQSIHNGWAK